jgi:hypothetical protein
VSTAATAAALPLDSSRSGVRAEAVRTAKLYKQKSMNKYDDEKGKFV